MKQSSNKIPYNSHKLAVAKLAKHSRNDNDLVLLLSKTIFYSKSKRKIKF